MVFAWISVRVLYYECVPVCTVLILPVYLWYLRSVTKAETSGSRTNNLCRKHVRTVTARRLPRAIHYITVLCCCNWIPDRHNWESSQAKPEFQCHVFKEFTKINIFILHFKRREGHTGHCTYRSHVGRTKKKNFEPWHCCYGFAIAFHVKRSTHQKCYIHVS